MRSAAQSLIGSIVLVLGSTLASGCADLAELEPGECGNGLLEPERGEDCDSAADKRCIGAGQLHECKYRCETTAECQAIGWGACATEGYCVLLDICGNGVVEEGEDCDDEDALVPGGTCVAQGKEGECQFDCSERLNGERTPCPDGWGCGPGDVCQLFDGCGNGVLEPELNEACDGLEAIEGASCLGPDASHPCQYDCRVVDGQRLPCPENWGCGPGDVCQQWTVCGNGTWEPGNGEDCDGEDSLEGGSCIAPGEENACHYDCSVGTDEQRTPCPPGWGCGPGDLCVQWDVCGNDAWEAGNGEDCDGVASLAGGTCIAAGEENECHYDCSVDGQGVRTPCPAEWGCGPGDLCVRWDVCGNDQWEPWIGEDCDGLAPIADGTCIAAGEDNECHYDCSLDGAERTPCPTGWGCGPDELCVQWDVCGNGTLEPWIGEECEAALTTDPTLVCGAPMTDDACRWRCVDPESDAAAPCPAGWGCGLDGYCRAGTGAFELASLTPFDQPIDTMHVGDFDGDGRSDLLLQTRTANWAVYGDGQGGLVDAVQMPADPGTPALGAVGGLTSTLPALDPRADAVLLGAGALSVYRGQADRTLAPTVYGSLALDGTSTSPWEVNQASVDAMPQACAELHWTGVWDATRYWGPELVVLGSELDGSKGATIYWPQALNDQGGELVKLAAVSFNVSELVGPLLAANVIPTPAPENPAPMPAECECEDLVFGFTGDPAIYLFSPCAWSQPPPNFVWKLTWNDGVAAVKDPGPARFLLPSSIAPPGTGLCGPMTLADANGDGRRDIIVGIGDGDCAALNPSSLNHYALLIDDGGAEGLTVWDPNPMTPGPDALDLVFYDPVNMTLLSRRPLLAFGQLNDDGVPDIVRTDGIWVSNGGTNLGHVDYYRVDPAALLPSGARYTEATIADLNRDGTMDAVARIGGAQAPLLVFFAGAGGGALNPSVVPAAFEPGSFAVGDFDGDLLLDVAFAEHDGSSNGALDSQLSVAFGTPFGTLEPPISEGSVPNAERVHAHNLHEQGFEGLADLVVVSNPVPDLLPTSVAILRGSPSRQLTSSYALPALSGVTTAHESTAVAAAVGYFTAANHLDLAALGESFFTGPPPQQAEWIERSLWLLPATGEAAIGHVTRLGLAGGPSATPLPALDSWLVPVDLDADTLDELVLLGSNEAGGNEWGGWQIFGGAKPGPGPWESRAWGTVPAQLGRGAAGALGLGAWGAAPTLAHLDADDAAEILTLGSLAQADPATSQLLAFTPDGQGGLTPIELALPADLPDWLTGMNVLAATAVESNGEPGDELFVALGSLLGANGTGSSQASGAIVASADLVTGALVDWSLVELPPQAQEQTVAGLWRLDFDGDGAEDVAMLVSGSAGSRVLLLHAVPSSP